MTAVADARGSTPRPGGGGCAPLAGKLAPPRLHVAVLPRSRVREKIDHAVEHRATLISAPAGSGKTTACASWSMTCGRAHDVAWLTVDPADNQPHRFWSHLAAALGQVQPSLRAPTPDRAPPMDLVDEIVEAVSGRDRPIVLVMDDIHELDQPEVLNGLDLLLRHAPPQLRLILSGRHRPDLQLARLRVSGDLAEIGAGDLAWTESEAAEYFRTADLPIGTDQVAELVARTGGWSTGLRLACLWLKEQCETDRQGRGFTGSTRIVGDYFRDEVLSRQKPEVRRFLLRTSVASPLSADLAGTLTGTADAARILDRLSRENCFVEAPDAGRPGYGFHPLFREFLRAELGRESPDDVPRLLGEAARRHRSNGRPLDALRAAVAGEDWEHAVEILAEDDVRVLLGAEDGELSAILTRLPPELASATPMVALAHAWTRLVAGDPDAAAPYIESAGRAAGTVEPRIDRIIAALNLVRAWMSGDCTPESLSTARRALHRTGSVPPRAPAERRATGCLLLALGLAHSWNVEFVSAGTALRRAVKDLEAGDFPALTCFATACAALIDAIQGDLTGAEETAGALQSDLARAKETAGPLHGPTPSPDGPLQPHTIAGLALAWVHMERDEPADVHRLLDRIEPWPRRRPPEDGPVSAFATLIRARALVAGGDVAAARSCLAELHRRCRLSSRLIQAVALLDIAWLPAADLPSLLPDLDPTAPALTDSEPAALTPATAEAVVPEPAAEGAGSPPPASDAVAMGRLHLIRNDPGRALVAVQDCLRGTAGETRLLDRIAALLVAAAAHRRLGATSPAAELLDQALELAEPHRARRVFLDGGRSVRSLLTILVPPNGPRVPFGNEILRRFERGAVNPNSDEGPALTQCELAVLRFLPSHMTNKEIAEDLFLSVNTVKTHLRSVYRKLGVTTRREAISQATRQGFV
ncbi:LuxR C-terminal-related transcriptional regulator [Streptosporangium subroseum]|uniref:helix-turn-helix transcriptional regulator n=1 Tax=Streptosporangium subroseum TaxID=106412 RepID=UPI0034360E58